jgi:ubiquinone/menaquinone biosynthesis C-methylase UbiE
VKKKEQIKVLIAGIGNDITPIQMYNDGWTNMVAFDYSESGIRRAHKVFGPSRFKSSTIKLITADCRELPLPQGYVDATLDKGTLDAISITGKDVCLHSASKLLPL